MVKKQKSPAKINSSRRKFLKTLGTGAAVVCAGAVIGVPRGHGAQPPDVTLPGNFGSMFRLPPFAPPTDAVREALLELGKTGGVMDAQDDPSATPVDLIANPDLSQVNRDNPNHSAGVTFFGQFLDHDMTFDPRSRLGFPTQPIKSPNARTPFFDLDSVYAGGPSGTSELYDNADPIKFLIESGGQFEDLPRNPANNAAFIGDARNDENLMLAGLHSAFLLFHNRAVDLVRSENPSITNDEAFSQARRLTVWHYQWIILHEFLPLITGQAVIDNVWANGRRYYNPLFDQEFIPVEFQIIYRFGHSMVRPSYRANLNGDNGEPFFGMIFDPAGEGSADPIDLRGGARAPRRFIDWQTFFDFGDPFTTDMRRNKRIDTKVSTPLFQLPLGTIPGGTGPVSLMQRNLLRHLTWKLPSGQSIAREMGVAPLESADLAELGSIYPSFVESTPLLYYILKEAEIREDGLRLGRVGARVVAEVFIGLLQLDPGSYLRVQPAWKPTLPTQGATEESFRMIDLLTFAGVDPTSRAD
ncbi:MAG TPA: heme peroxidase family protein [Candidatus Binatia bacterium]|jgi:Animal haem peroxidase